MPRTAPAVDGTPITKEVSLRYIDASGDKFADSYLVPAAATDAQIEAWATAMGDATNANLYEVVIRLNYSDIPDVDEAVNATKDSGFDVLNVLLKNPSKLTHSLTLRAPIDAALLDGSGGNLDIIDPDSTEVSDAIQAFTVVVNVGGGTFEAISARYSERKEVNQKVSI